MGGLTEADEKKASESSKEQIELENIEGEIRSWNTVFFELKRLEEYLIQGGDALSYSFSSPISNFCYFTGNRHFQRQIENDWKTMQNSSNKEDNKGDACGQIQPVALIDNLNEEESASISQTRPEKRDELVEAGTKHTDSAQILCQDLQSDNLLVAKEITNELKNGDDMNASVEFGKKQTEGSVEDETSQMETPRDSFEGMTAGLHSLTEEQIPDTVDEAKESWETEQTMDASIYLEKQEATVKSIPQSDVQECKVTSHSSPPLALPTKEEQESNEKEAEDGINLEDIEPNNSIDMDSKSKRAIDDMTVAAELQKEPMENASTNDETMVEFGIQSDMEDAKNLQRTQARGENIVEKDDHRLKNPQTAEDEMITSSVERQEISKLAATNLNDTAEEGSTATDVPGGFPEASNGSATQPQVEKGVSLIASGVEGLKRKSEISKDARKAHEDVILEEAEMILIARKQRLEILKESSTFPHFRSNKTHWDYVLEEMAWMANDFAQERLWKVAASAQVVRWVQKKNNEDQSRILLSRKLADMVSEFWKEIRVSLEGKVEEESEADKKTVDIKEENREEETMMAVERMEEEQTVAVEKEKEGDDTSLEKEGKDDVDTAEEQDEKRGEADEAGKGKNENMEEGKTEEDEEETKIAAEELKEEESGSAMDVDQKDNCTVEEQENAEGSLKEERAVEEGNSGTREASGTDTCRDTIGPKAQHPKLTRTGVRAYAKRFLGEEDERKAQEEAVAPGTPERSKETASGEWLCWEELEEHPLTVFVPEGSMEQYRISFEMQWNHAHAELMGVAIPEPLPAGAPLPAREEAEAEEAEDGETGEEEEGLASSFHSMGPPSSRISKRKRNPRETSGIPHKQLRVSHGLPLEDSLEDVPLSARDLSMEAEERHHLQGGGDHPGVGGVAKRQRTSSSRVPRGSGGAVGGSRVPGVFRDREKKTKAGEEEMSDPANRTDDLHGQLKKRRAGDAVEDCEEEDEEEADKQPPPQQPPQRTGGPHKEKLDARAGPASAPERAVRRVGPAQRLRKVLGAPFPASQPVGVPWTELEDNGLLGMGPLFFFNWPLISDVLNAEQRLKGLSRSAGQCRDRYTVLLQQRRASSHGSNGGAALEKKKKGEAEGGRGAPLPLPHGIPRVGPTT